MLMVPCEACQIMSAIDAVKKVPGDMAEPGVASGASAMMIASRSLGESCTSLTLLKVFRSPRSRTARNSGNINTAIPSKTSGGTSRVTVYVSLRTISGHCDSAVRHKIRVRSPGR
jgi:hypothetical protein